MVDLAIDDAHGATFWKKYFLTEQPSQELEEFVKWPDFVNVLKKETGITDGAKFEILYPYLGTFPFPLFPLHLSWPGSSL